jgi:hypothetical protein
MAYGAFYKRMIPVSFADTKKTEKACYGYVINEASRELATHDSN